MLHVIPKYYNYIFNVLSLSFITWCRMEMMEYIPGRHDSTCTLVVIDIRRLQCYGDHLEYANYGSRWPLIFFQHAKFGYHYKKIH